MQSVPEYNKQSTIQSIKQEEKQTSIIQLPLQITKKNNFYQQQFNDSKSILVDNMTNDKIVANQSYLLNEAYSQICQDINVDSIIKQDITNMDIAELDQLVDFQINSYLQAMISQSIYQNIQRSIHNPKNLYSQSIKSQDKQPKIQSYQQQTNFQLLLKMFNCKMESIKSKLLSQKEHKQKLIKQNHDLLSVIKQQHNQLYLIKQKYKQNLVLFNQDRKIYRSKLEGLECLIQEEQAKNQELRRQLSLKQNQLQNSCKELGFVNLDIEKMKLLHSEEINFIRQSYEQIRQTEYKDFMYSVNQALISYSLSFREAINCHNPLLVNSNANNYQLADYQLLFKAEVKSKSIKQITNFIDGIQQINKDKDRIIQGQRLQLQQLQTILQEWNQFQLKKENVFKQIPVKLAKLLQYQNNQITQIIKNQNKSGQQKCLDGQINIIDQILGVVKNYLMKSAQVSRKTSHKLIGKQQQVQKLNSQIVFLNNQINMLNNQIKQSNSLNNKLRNQNLSLNNQITKYKQKNFKYQQFMLKFSEIPIQKNQNQVEILPIQQNQKKDQNNQKQSVKTEEQKVFINLQLNDQLPPNQQIINPDNSCIQLSKTIQNFNFNNKLSSKLQQSPIQILSMKTQTSIVKSQHKQQCQANKYEHENIHVIAFQEEKTLEQEYCNTNSAKAKQINKTDLNLSQKQITKAQNIINKKEKIKQQQNMKQYNEKQNDLEQLNFNKENQINKSNVINDENALKICKSCSKKQYNQIQGKKSNDNKQGSHEQRQKIQAFKQNITILNEIINYMLNTLRGYSFSQGQHIPKQTTNIIKTAKIQIKQHRSHQLQGFSQKVFQSSYIPVRRYSYLEYQLGIQNSSEHDNTLNDLANNQNRFTKSKTKSPSYQLQQKCLNGSQIPISESSHFYKQNNNVQQENHLGKFKSVGKIVNKTLNNTINLSSELHHENNLNHKSQIYCKFDNKTIQKVQFDKKTKSLLSKDMIKQKYQNVQFIRKLCLKQKKCKDLIDKFNSYVHFYFYRLQQLNLIEIDTSGNSSSQYEKIDHQIYHKSNLNKSFNQFTKSKNQNKTSKNVLNNDSQRKYAKIL